MYLSPHSSTVDGMQTSSRTRRSGADVDVRATCSEVLEIRMKVKYDPEVDNLRIILNDAPVEESDESRPGVILDFDASGNVVGFEVLNASKR
jgi:uncharacterized protein YuzE